MFFTSTEVCSVTCEEEVQSPGSPSWGWVPSRTNLSFFVMQFCFDFSPPVNAKSHLSHHLEILRSSQKPVVGPSDYQGIWGNEDRAQLLTVLYVLYIL